MVRNNNQSDATRNPTARPSRNRTSNVPLFIFRAGISDSDNSSVRPKRRLKSVLAFNPRAPTTTGDFCGDPENCKAGDGFLCPRCSNDLSYDATECDVCQLSCYYEAGCGVVVSRERSSQVPTLAAESPTPTPASTSDGNRGRRRAREELSAGSGISTSTSNKSRRRHPQASDGSSESDSSSEDSDDSDYHFTNDYFEGFSICGHRNRTA